MKKRFYIEYDRANPPNEGDMFVYKDGNWIKLKTEYTNLDAPSGDPLTTKWNPKEAMNRKLTVAFGLAFTIEIIGSTAEEPYEDHLKNGMSGDLVLTVEEGIGPAPTSITLTGYVNVGTQVDVSGNGSLSNLSSGVYHICWVFDGTRLTYNIGKYDDTF